jgi:hypothetical protein
MYVETYHGVESTQAGGSIQRLILPQTLNIFHLEVYCKIFHGVEWTSSMITCLYNDELKRLG